MSTTTTPTSPRRGRLAVGIVLVALAVVVAGSGGALLWAHLTQRDAAGYYTTAAHRLHTPTRAIATEKIAIGHHLPSWVDAGFRVEVTSTSARPVFIGIAHTADAQRYLAGTNYATVKDLELDPFAARYVAHAGGAAPTAPAAQHIWVTSAQGAGTQKVFWKLQSGDWSVVTMNADGSPGVEVLASVGAQTSLVLPTGIGLASGGTLLLVAGVLLIATSSRRRPTPGTSLVAA